MKIERRQGALYKIKHRHSVPDGTVQRIPILRKDNVTLPVYCPTYV